MTATNDQVMAELGKVAAAIALLDGRLQKVERTDQVAASTVPSGDGETDIGIPDVAEQVSDTLPTVSDLDIRLAVTEDAVLAAGRLADEAAELGAAAGEDGRAAAAFADEKADDALARADEAKQNAQDAIDAIPDIQAAADAADQKATDAQSAASDASAAAASAAGVAAAAAQVFIQASPPSGTRADPKNLWIDTSLDANGNPRNRPNRYNPDTAKWEPVTDQAAVDAAAAAVAAKSTADAAAAAATHAQASADGKTTTIYSPVAPNVDGVKAGDTWFVRSTSTGIVTGVYEWSGTAWVQRTLDNATIANLDAGKINAGYIAAARIAAQTITSDMIAAATILAANIAADTLTSREIAADAITAAELAADAVIARNIKAGTITAGKLAAASVVAENIVAATITGDKMAANTVTAREILAGSITADLLSATAIDGKTITGATVRTAATGKRVVLGSNVLSFFDTNNLNSGTIQGTNNGGSRSLLYLGGSSASMTIGPYDMPVQGTASVHTDTAWIEGMFVSTLANVSSPNDDFSVIGVQQWSGSTSVASGGAGTSLASSAAPVTQRGKPMTNGGNNAIIPAGVYLVMVTSQMSTAATARAFLNIGITGLAPSGRSQYGVGENWNTAIGVAISDGTTSGGRVTATGYHQNGSTLTFNWTITYIRIF